MSVTAQGEVTSIPSAVQALAVVVMGLLIAGLAYYFRADLETRRRLRAGLTRNLFPLAVGTVLAFAGATRLDADIGTRGYLAAYTGVLAIYAIALVWIARRSKAEFPEAWDAIKHGRDVDPIIRERIEDHGRKAVVFATIPVVLYVTILIILAD